MLAPVTEALLAITFYPLRVMMHKDKKEAVPQEPPKIDMKALNVVVKKVLNYGPAKANRQSETGK